MVSIPVLDHLAIMFIEIFEVEDVTHVPIGIDQDSMVTNHDDAPITRKRIHLRNYFFGQRMRPTAHIRSDRGALLQAAVDVLIVPPLVPVLIDPVRVIAVPVAENVSIAWREMSCLVTTLVVTVLSSDAGARKNAQAHQKPLDFHCIAPPCINWCRPQGRRFHTRCSRDEAEPAATCTVMR
jgi:hypothetical protein